jgi:hypothetical protein
VDWLGQMEAKVGCNDCSMIKTFHNGLTFCLIVMKPLPITPLLSSIQGTKGLRKGDQYYWVNVHENPKES